MTSTLSPVDLDEARAVLADNGVDGPDLPYNPRVLRAMRVADALLAEVGQLRVQVGFLREVAEALAQGVAPDRIMTDEWDGLPCFDDQGRWIDR